MSRRKRKGIVTGFEEWGGYMSMKKSKLEEQFSEAALKAGQQKSNLFQGISIFVNGYTDPSADELRNLMMQHGGIYHHYYRSGNTTYVIASNLPDSKLKQTQGIKFLKPTWVTDCIRENKILDFREYLLYNNQTKSQPGLKYFSEKIHDTAENKQNIKTANDKGFLSEFYNNSRLHHISTMGSLFKQYVNDLRSNNDHKFSGREELMCRAISKPDDISNESLEGTNSKAIMHIDMDCFFVSVGTRDKPELKGIPVAVTHAKGNRSQPRESLKKEVELYKQKAGWSSVNPDGTPSTHWADSLSEMDSMAEVASCSYEARAAGVKNGMFLGQALKLCPTLKPIPYNFEAYKEVSCTLYDTVARYTLDIEAVSCDEMYVDCTELLKELSLNPLEFATILRNEIKAKTSCPCSVGFGGNKLQARIATKKAKPDGQFYLDSNIEDFFKNIFVSDLPGVGYSTSYKLKSLGVKTCGDLQSLPLKSLQRDFGLKIGETLYKNCRGIDDKELVFNQVRKSVSAEVNYGIRFNNDSERDAFLDQLSKEVSDRVKNVKMKGRSITLKLMVRSKDAPEETAKFLGHGVCDHITKSTILPNAISDPAIIFREVLKIVNKLKVDSKDLRGIGIQLTRLECSESTDNGLMKFLNNPKNNTEKQNKSNDDISAIPGTSRATSKHQQSSRDTSSGSLANLTISQVDQSFLSAVPDDIREEILCHLKRNNKTKSYLTFEKKVDNSSSSENDDSTIQETVEEDSTMDNDAVKSFVSPGELKTLLKDWIELEDNPISKDINFVNNYLQELVLKGHLEELSVILKYFHRFIERYSKPDTWKCAYNTVLGGVQTKMRSVYKGELALDERFTCF